MDYKNIRKFIIIISTITDNEKIEYLEISLFWKIKLWIHPNGNILRS